MVMAGPAPGRPNWEPAWDPERTRSSTVAFRIDLIGTTFPAAAVPVKVKMPEPITAPMPRAAQFLIGIFGGGDQCFDTFGTKQAHVYLNIAPAA